MARERETVLLSLGCSYLRESYRKEEERDRCLCLRRRALVEKREKGVEK